jgi:hypothetical protein
MITVDPTFLDDLFGNVAAMINGLKPVEIGIFSVLLFGFLVRQILHWIKVMRYI